VALLLAFVASTPAQESSQELESPRLIRLAEDVLTRNGEAVESFWREIADQAPLIEAIAGDDSHRYVTFVWRGDGETRSVDMLGDVPTTRRSKWGMRRLSETNVWFKTERVPKDSR